MLLVWRISHHVSVLSLWFAEMFALRFCLLIMFGRTYSGDVDGSVEAIVQALSTYPNQQCQLHIVDYNTGSVSESDIDAAAAFGGEN